ncbi:MAG: crossover junction endodeoxyribonuclease RuvC [Nitrospiraceae bacterium]|nr:crossover junction endodeoxyribonuclease RuvC [Nitrospiraceae bacterium]
MKRPASVNKPQPASTCPAPARLRGGGETGLFLPELVLGIDPGSIYCGYGLVKRTKNNSCVYVSSGRFGMTKSAPLEHRLMELFEGLSGLVRELSPQAGAVEKIFFAKNARAALSLGHARGIALLALANGGVPVYEYSALEVKKAVTGYGRAEKHQVQEMIKRLLGLKFSPSTDGADALALAFCHINKQDYTSPGRAAVHESYGE